MNKKYFMFSVIIAMFFAVIVASCDKEAEMLLEIAKKEWGEHKAVYDDQNRVVKALWYDKENNVYKKTLVTYGDDWVKLKFENSSYDEFTTISEYTTIFGINFGAPYKKVYIDY